MIKAKSSVTSNQVQAFTDGILSLKGKVPGIETAFAGPTFTTERAKGFTHLLVVHLPTRDALATYDVHPERTSPLALQLTILDVAVKKQFILPLVDNPLTDILAVDLEV
jgi:hypothetical protein